MKEHSTAIERPKVLLNVENNVISQFEMSVAWEGKVCLLVGVFKVAQSRRNASQ